MAVLYSLSPVFSIMTGLQTRFSYCSSFVMLCNKEEHTEDFLSIQTLCIAYCIIIHGARSTQCSNEQKILSS